MIFDSGGELMTKFIFDLDGTVTREETLPLIAKHFSVEEEIMVVMVQQEAMAEEEEGAVVRILNPIREVLVAAVLVELD